MESWKQQKEAEHQIQKDFCQNMGILYLSFHESTPKTQSLYDYKYYTALMLVLQQEIQYFPPHFQETTKYSFLNNGVMRTRK